MSFTFAKSFCFEASSCFIFNRGKSDSRPAVDAPEGEIALNVTNHNYLDVVIYILHDGQRTRVGMVTGSSSAVFFIPVRLLGMGHELQLYGDAIGNDAIATAAKASPLQAKYGQTIDPQSAYEILQNKVAPPTADAPLPPLVEPQGLPNAEGEVKSRDGAEPGMLEKVMASPATMEGR